MKNLPSRNYSIICLTIFGFSFVATFSSSAQPIHDLCENAIEVQTFTDQGFICLESNNFGATPEVYNNDCQIRDYPVVWFRVPVDVLAGFLNVNVQSYEMESPTINVFRGSGCSNLIFAGCIIGTTGRAEISTWNFYNDSVFYIAVGSVHSLGGTFTLCINTVSDFPSCASTANIQVIERTEDGPLSGPFYPGETVRICMNVFQFDAQDGCQWFQGIVPVFGNAWHPGSFDVEGQPQSATLNGNPIGNFGNGLYANTTWDWFTDVGYHYTREYYQVGDHDGNGTVDMCHTLFEADCPDTGGLAGGCCPPCWHEPVDLLPPGWFAYGIDGSCNIPGPPVSFDWGDGETCSQPAGPWSFCFDLTTLDYPECLANVTMPDLSLAFFVFADGEIGAWGGFNPVAGCSNDRPVQLRLPFCCEQPVEEEVDLDTIYSGQQVYHELYQPGILFWEWTAENGFITGENSGEGDSNAVIINTLVNPTNQPRLVQYQVFGYANGTCPDVEITIEVWVLPQLLVELEAPLLCSAQTYILSPQVTGCSPLCTYQWSPGNETTPTIVIDQPVDGSIYAVTVTDGFGTTASAEVTLSVYTTFEVVISPMVAEQCINDPTELTSQAFSGQGPYTVLWSLPDGSTEDTENIYSDLCGIHAVHYMDDAGCTGSDTIDLICHQNPIITIHSENGDVLCTGDSTLLTPIIINGESPFTFEWSTPLGHFTNGQISVSNSGNYYLIVTDANGCIGEHGIFLTFHNNPVVDLGPDSIAIVDLIILDAGNPGLTFHWSTGDTSQMITVTTPGLYSVEVIDSLGCLAFDSIFVEVITNVIHLDQTSLINIYPNPNTGQFSITFHNQQTSLARIQIRDVLGRKIYDHGPAPVQSGSRIENLPGLTNGTYTVMIELDGDFYVGKVVVLEK